MKQTPYPNWAKWVAKDADGKCWVYLAEPLLFHKGWYENEIGQYEQVCCPKELKNLDWQDALIKVQNLSG